MQKIDLLPCPFCGSDNVTIIKNKSIDGLFASECIKCKVSTAFYVNEKFAAETWNTRAPGWIPCSERLPDDNVDVLVYDDCILIARYNSNEEYTSGWMESFECYPLTNATHWMPLPAPPEVINNVD